MSEPQPSFDPNLIFVVDDDPDFIEKAVGGLSQDLPSVEFVKLANGNICVDEYEKRNPKPAIVILDLMLPGRSGFLVLDKLKPKTRRGTVPPIVIMVTVNPGLRHQQYAEALGVFRYLRKPFQMTVLLTAVQDARGIILQPT